MKKQIIIGSIILICIVACVVFIISKNNSKDISLQAKTEDEIEHLEEKIVAMMNSLNKITLSNSVLVEEKTNENSQTSGNTKQSNDNSQEDGEESSSQSSDSSSSSGSSDSDSDKENTTKGNSKYEIVNDSILTNQNQTVDWEYIKSSAETIHSSWATLTIDLHSLNVNNQDILNFSNVLDQVTLSVKQEDKTATLNNLASLYAFFPIYIKQISNDSEKINIDYTKTCVLNSYALIEQNKWDEMKLQVTNGINYFTNILNSVNDEKQNQNKLSKTYVLLNELNNSIDLKDKDLYMIKYRNVMEELVNF